MGERKRASHKKTMTPRFERAAAKNLEKAVAASAESSALFDPKCLGLVKYATFNGAKDADLARMLNVCRATILTWKSRYPAFGKAVNEGREMIVPRVTQALVRRALGYKHKAVKIFMPAGASEPVYAPYIEHYPPDTAAAIAILERRGGDQWAPPALRHKIGGDPDNQTPVGVVIVPAKAP